MSYKNGYDLAAAIADGINGALQSLFGDVPRRDESVGQMLLDAYAIAGGGSRSSAAEDLGALVQVGLDGIASSIGGHAKAVETIGEEFGRIADALERLSRQLGASRPEAMNRTDDEGASPW